MKNIKSGKKNNQLLYDLVMTHALQWPSPLLSGFLK